MSDHAPYGLLQTVAPAEEPVTLAEAKAHARIEGGDDDDLVTALIVGARRYAENFTRRALITQTWEMTMDAFPGFESGREPWWDGVRQGAISDLRMQDRFGDKVDEFGLPKAPLQSVTQVSTFGQDDTESVFADTNYLVDTKTVKGRIALRFGGVWPTDLRRIDAVRIVLVAGYGLQADVPQEIKQAMMMLISHHYETREAVCESAGAEVPFGVTMLLDYYRVVDL